MSGLKMCIRLIFSIAAICAIASSCERVIYPLPPGPDTTKYISFDTIIKPIFSNDGCLTCHSSAANPPKLSTDPYNALVPAYIQLSDSINPESSLFYNWITTNSDHIPRTSAADKANIKLWISQGVRHN
jgi:hypothetical protein